MPSPPLLFLSHAGEDGAAARETTRRLRDAGVGVWLDLDDLKPGLRHEAEAVDHLVDQEAAVAHLLHLHPTMRDRSPTLSR